jgi:hypothetical protein
MQGGKNRILPKEINANRFFRDANWLEIWKNHFCPSMGPNGGSVTKGSGVLHLVCSPPIRLTEMHKIVVKHATYSTVHTI